MGYYYTRDHLGSVREMVNSSGTIVARYSYDPYGNTTLVSGTNIATFHSELHGPTIAPEVPTKNKRRNQLLGYEHTPRGLSLPTSNKTAKRLAHLMPLSQLTKSVVEGSFTLNTRIERRSWLRLLLLCRFPVKQNELGCQHSLFEK